MYKWEWVLWIEGRSCSSMRGLCGDNKMGKAITMVGAMWLWKGETDWKTYSLWPSHSYWASSKKSTHLRVKKRTSLSPVKELETTASMRQIKTSKSEPRSPTPSSSGKLETGEQERSEGNRRSCSQNVSGSERSDWENWPLDPSLACLLKVVATAPSSSLSLSTDFF